MPYSYLTLAQCRSQLSARLYDTSANAFWSDAEKNQYIIESLRNWNALTSLWRKEFIFPTVANTVWYDLTTQANSTRPMTLTDNDLTQMIEYHLLEPLTSAYPLAWTGSSQFAITDILSAIQRCRDEVLSLTSCTISRLTVGAAPGRTFLPDNVLDIRRVAWLPVADPNYVNCPLFPDDEFGLQAFENDFSTRPNGNPSSYRRSSQPPLSFDTDIGPAINGNYEILTVSAGAALSINAATPLNIPDDFAWVIKWGALADLLSRESNAKDILRARYCDIRYRQGISLLRTASALLYARLNNIPLDIESVQEADHFRPGWQAEAAAQPDTLLVSGLNLVALAAVPDTGIYSVTAGVVQNAPIPTQDTDLIQIGRDDLEAILDHSQHLASFKMGGLEFLSTAPLLERYHNRAAAYNSKLNSMGEFTKPMFEMSQLQAENNPVFEADPIQQ